MKIGEYKQMMSNLTRPGTPEQNKKAEENNKKYLADRKAKTLKVVDQWKYFFEYLQNRDFCYGTWAEGFEIGISSHIAGFNGMNLDSHPQWGLWSNWMTASGYRNGHKGDVHYETER